MKRMKRAFAILIAGIMVFAAIPTAFAAGETTAKIVDGKVTLTFSSGHSLEKREVKMVSEGGDSVYYEDIYHVAPDATITAAYNGGGDYSLDAGGYKITLAPTQKGMIKYFSSEADAKAFFDGNAAKDVLPILDKKDTRIYVEFIDADGATNSWPLFVNFDGVGTSSAPAKNPTNTQTAVASSATLKTTANLNKVIPPLPTPGQDLQYTVQPSETLVGIAYNYYGSMSANAVAKIKNANAAYFKKTKGVLEAYAVITLPKQGLINPVTVSGIPNAAGTYLVNQGNNLAEIAKVFYGNTSAWTKIYNANKDRIKMIGNSPMIYEGQWIIIPN